MNQRTRLRFLLSAALVAAFLFSTAGVQAAQPEAPTVNLILWIFSDTLNPTETAAVNAYQLSHPDVSITVYHPANLMGELASAPPEALPDIILYPNDAMAMLLLNHHLIRLESYGITSVYLSANYEPAAVQAAMFGGVVYAIPHLQEGIALLYNKDTLPAQYLPTDPLGFTDLASKAALYRATYPTKTLICNQGFSSVDAYHVAPIFFGYGIPDYIDQAGRIYVNDPRAVSAAGWIHNLRAVSLAANDYDTCKNGLLNGSVGMWWTGPWAVTGLNAGGLASDKIGLAPMGIPYVGIKQNMVTAYAASRGYADEAIDFIKFFDGTANSILYATQENQIPANTAALNSTDVQALPLITAFADAIALGTPLAKSIYSSCQWEPVALAVGELWNNPAALPQTEMNEAQAEVQACVNSLRDTYFPHSLNLPLLKR